MATSPPPDLRFRWPWRPYQARLLDTVERHLGDDRLHIVAAPGAGKTTLGLEVFRRLEQPALVLAPTLTIRDQWMLRLRDFLPEGRADGHVDGLAAWTSTNVFDPSFLTVTTYQALLARHRADLSQERAEDDAAEAEGAPSGEDVRSFLALFRDVGLGTLILDEAHHLRQEWWKALVRVVEEIPGLTLVSLTATPPYDATGREWQRYEDLCGPIDDEISVPELVKAGTLCPHQDFVLVVPPVADEARAVLHHDRAVEELLLDLMEDADFQAQVDRHPWVVAESPDPEVVLDRPELAVALLVYLTATEAGLTYPLLEVLNLQPGELPHASRRWWQVLLTEYLFGSTFDASAKSHRDALATRLRSSALLWRRDLRIGGSRPVVRSLALSAAKVEGCLDIYRAERELRGGDLRQVILTDFIRDEGLNEPPGTLPVELGAFPVFDALARSLSASEAQGVALVSGRLCLLNESVASAFLEAVGNSAKVRLTPAPHRPGWLRAEGVGGSRLVEAYTSLLAAGQLNVLVGTRSLLGEGWDAPSVNSVVLASFVGSFVSTNQMRGRGIRTNPNDPEKIASVWHLAALVPDTPTGVMDMEQLEERFRTFVGLSADGKIIESGIGRLALPPWNTAREIHLFNEETFRRHRELDEVPRAWARAIRGNGPGKVVPTLGVARVPTVRPFHTRKTLRYLLYEVGWSGLAAVGWSFMDLGGADSLHALGFLLATGSGLAMLAITPRLWRALAMAIKHLPIDGSVAQMGRALLEALRAMGLVEDPDEKLRVHTERSSDGGITVALNGGTFYEQSVFADAMGEILGPVANPRYIITREGEGSLRHRKDFHAVPTCLGVKKARAEAFLAAWIRHVGPAELIFTRREGGRALLLAARSRAFSGAFEEDGMRRLDRWQ